MSENEETVSDLDVISNLIEEHAACVIAIEDATKRKLEIELRLSIVKQALERLDTPARKPRGRPRKTPVYAEPVEVEEFDGNTVCE